MLAAERRRTLLTLVSLAVLYTVWGSTYLAQRVAVSSFAPLQMAGLRFLVAGGLLYGFLRARGTPAPTSKEWRAVVLSAVPLLVTGMGAAAVGIKRVPSGLAALVFGSVPLWTSLIDRLWGGKLRRSEIAGLAIPSPESLALPTQESPWQKYMLAQQAATQAVPSLEMPPTGK